MSEAVNHIILCAHEDIAKTLRSDTDWDGESCLVGHLMDGVSISDAGCWSCPDCGAYISYKSRQCYLAFLRNEEDYDSLRDLLDDI